MSGGRFWRNVAIIAVAHVVLVIAFVRWSGAAKTNSSQQIVWLSGDKPANTTSDSAGGAPPIATPEATETPQPEDEPTIAAAKSEIQLPAPTPTPSATPRPIVKLSPPPVAKPAQTPKAVVRSAPRKSIAKATPKPQKKKAPDRSEADDETEVEAVRDALSKSAGSGGNGAGGTSTRGETQWYGRMLHDRFHNAWDQPTTVVASGAKMSALVKVRIEKDGRVSRFEVVRPSGNVVVDESVRAVASKVTQVDPLPSGVGNGEHYDVTINFELNPED